MSLKIHAKYVNKCSRKQTNRGKRAKRKFNKLFLIVYRNARTIRLFRFYFCFFISFLWAVFSPNGNEHKRRGNQLMVIAVCETENMFTKSDYSRLNAVNKIKNNSNSFSLPSSPPINASHKTRGTAGKNHGKVIINYNLKPVIRYSCFYIYFSFGCALQIISRWIPLYLITITIDEYSFERISHWSFPRESRVETSLWACGYSNLVNM